MCHFTNLWGSEMWILDQNERCLLAVPLQAWKAAWFLSCIVSTRRRTDHNQRQSVQLQHLPLLPGTLWPLYWCLAIFKKSLHSAPLQAFRHMHTRSGRRTHRGAACLDLVQSLQRLMERLLLISEIFSSSLLEMAKTEHRADGSTGNRPPVWLPAPRFSP